MNTQKKGRAFCVSPALLATMNLHRCVKEEVMGTRFSVMFRMYITCALSNLVIESQVHHCREIYY